MKAICGFVCVLVLVAGCVKEKPVKIDSKDYNFKLDFPGTPKSETKEVDAPPIGKLKLNVQTWESRGGGEAVMVNVTDYPVPAEQFDAQAGLDGGAAEIGKGANVAMGKIESIEYGPDKLPARKFLLERTDKKMWVRNLMVIKGSRLYHVLMVGSKDYVTNKAADAIFDSFEITK